MNAGATPLGTLAGAAPHRIHLLEVVGNAIVGGMESCVLRLVERLPPERFRISALAPFESGFTTRLRALGVEVLIVPMPEELSWSALQIACALVRETGVDVLHAHMANAFLLAATCGRLTGRPVLTTIHARQLSILDLEVQQATGSHVSAVCSHTYWHALGLGVPAERLSCIPNGVDGERFRPGPRPEDGLRRAFGIAADAPVVGCVARLSPEKGIDVFLRLALLLNRLLPEAHCVLVGDGPLRAEAEAFIARFALDRVVHLAGERADMPEVYREFDLFASTSLSEALPLALMEAMASGLPVVATRMGGVPELIEHGRTGWLVGPRDFEGGANRVAQILGTTGERERMGAAARERALERFSLTASVQQTVRLLQRLVLDDEHGEHRERPASRLGTAAGGAVAPDEPLREGTALAAARLPARRSQG